MAENKGKLVMGYWDCSYCSTVKIEGTKRECPNCGRPRGENVKFYMDKEKKYLTEEESKNKGKGEDWFCEYCDTLNSVTDTVCKSCGAPREENSKTYSSMKKEPKKTEEAKKEPKPAEKKPDQTVKPRKRWKIVTAAIASVLLLAAIIFALLPETDAFYIHDVQWKTVQSVEECKTLHKSGWKLPDGARLTDSATELYGYHSVVDHYKTVTKSKKEKVLDHYKTEYKYSDNGDGTFTEKSYEKPVYKYETKQYKEKVPVYRKEPVYKTKYYYDIDKWSVTDKLTKKGSKGKDPIAYAAVTETKKQRAGEKKTYYTCTATIVGDSKAKEKPKKYKISKKLYQTFEKGKKYKCTYAGDEIFDLEE